MKKWKSSFKKIGKCAKPFPDISKKTIVAVRKKKKLTLFLFLIFYSLFWFWYFSGKNKNDLPVDQFVNRGVKKNDKQHKSNKKTTEEFSREELGNFWLEIDVSDLKIKAPIFNGIEPAVLEKGLGKHRTTVLPGQNGNLVISGHRWKFGDKPSYKIFENLDKLKKGDRVKIHYNNKVFVYEVYESGIVSPSKENGKKILKKTSESILTLYTCTPKYTSWKRLYYRAKLIK